MSHDLEAPGGDDRCSSFDPQLKAHIEKTSRSMQAVRCNLRSLASLQSEVDEMPSETSLKGELGTGVHDYLTFIPWFYDQFYLLSAG